MQFASAGKGAAAESQLDTLCFVERKGGRMGGMRIHFRAPSSVACASFLVGLFCISRMEYQTAAAATAVLAAVLAAVALWRKKSRRWIAAAAGLLIAFAAFSGYRNHTIAPLAGLSGEKCEITAVVADLPEEMEWGVRIPLRTQSISGAEGEAVRVKTGLAAYFDTAPQVEIGDRIVFRAVLRPTKETQRYHASRGYLYTVSIKDGEYAINPAARPPLYRFAAELRAAFAERAAQLLPAREAALTCGIVLGDKSGFDGKMYAAFRATGMSHAVAVSGMHIHILTAFLLLLFRLVKLPDRWSAVLLCPMIVGFVALAGFAPSAMRAGIMAIILCGGRIFRRETEAVNSLLIATSLICLIRPFYIQNLGLQLSFVSSLSILLFGERLTRCFCAYLERIHIRGKAADFLAGTTAVTLAACAATAPILGAVFGEISLLSFIAMPLCTFAITGIFVGGLLLMLLGWAAPVGTAIALPVKGLCGFVLWLLESLAKFPYALIPVAYPFVAIGAAAAVLMALVCLRAQRRGRAFATAALLCAGIVLIGAVQYRPLSALLEPERYALFTAIDVGQGDAIAVLNGRSAVLIDAGGTSSAAAQEITRYLRSRGAVEIEAMILTHGHRDHTVAAAGVLESMPVRQLCLPQPDAEDPAYDAILDAAKDAGCPVEFVREDRVLLLQNGLGLTLYGSLAADERMQTDNEKCMPVAVSFGDSSMLVTGDMTRESELIFLRYENMDPFDVLKVAHHGSADSTTPLFLEQIMPRAALVSVGNNSYGLPADKTIQRLAESGCAVYRTDERGTVEILADRNGEIACLAAS